MIVFPFVLEVIGIPAYNEEKNIAAIITKIMKEGFSVIVCNDGSDDMTGTIAEKMGATVINHPKNLGYGAAIRSIFLKAKEIDGICRDAISNVIPGGEFLHGTGHGVGLEIHEYPSINSRSDDILREGMVITVEPGIYIQGSYGVRWEDLLLVTDSGVEYLTNYEKRTQVLDSNG